MPRGADGGILKIGIIGTGRIAARFVPEAAHVPGIKPECVYNPHIDSAGRFSERFAIGFATDCLAELFARVDAVYIASPHMSHSEYALAALGAGKHVLCEKPMALKKSDAIAAVSLAKRRGLVLMEGVKTAYCPGFAALLSVARSGVIGEVKDAEACFTKLIPGGAVRERTGADAGAFRELASYPLLAIAKIFGTAPLSARFDSLADESGADGYTKAYFRFKGGFASLKVGISVKSEGELILSGTKGYILVKAPWWKTESFDVRYEDVSRNETFRCAFLGDGLRYEIADFRAAVGGDAVARGKLTEAEMVFMADMMERFSAFEGETAGRRREGRGETACTII